METFEERLRAVRGRIAAAAGRAGRRAESVTLVAVSKTIPVEGIREALAAGIGLLGENRVQEAREKITALPGRAAWHLVGHLQSNKARMAVQLFDCIQSLDSVRLAEEIDRHAAQVGKVQRCLVEVNLGGEAQKGGVSEGEVDGILEVVRRLPNLAVDGLMCVPPFLEEPEAVRPFFRRLRELAERLRGAGQPLRELSMGMTGDFEVAVEEGATMVRIGTALFGTRPRI
jgi:pyridoxal phosphate enzyme (YggS family)